MKNSVLVLTLVCLFFGLEMNLLAQNPEVYPLWPNGAKESNGITAVETTDPDGRVANISVAELSVYHPAEEKSTGMAVIICPGGGYGVVSRKYEGDMFASWLIERGITAVVLKYRLPNHHSSVPLADAQRAIRLVRSRAEEWGIKSEEIGIAGFSAGGHLASTAGTHFDKGSATAKDRLERFSSRPDFMVLFYPVISFSGALVHQGSRNALLGKKPTAEQIDFYSNELQVTAQTPPAFIVHCDDDPVVSSLNSVVFYQKLRSKNVPAVLFVFDKGGHGWGLRDNFEYYQQWTGLLEKWLQSQSAKPSVAN